jgi:hypothetical protein
MLRTVRNLSLTVLAAVLTLAAADPSLGTWKVNTAKSKFNGPAPNLRTVVVSQDGDWIVQKSEGVNAEGKATTSSNRYKRDGKEYPWQSSLTGPAKITNKRIDDYHYESVLRGEAGVSNVRTVTVLSKDGKTRTQTVTGVNAKGEKFNNVVVYDRQ